MLNLNQLFIWLIPLLIWEIIWKGFALWKAAKNNQRNWFIVMLFLNTAGILPIIYIKFFQANKINDATQ